MADPFAKVKKAVKVKRAVSSSLSSKAAQASSRVSDSRSSSQKVSSGSSSSTSRVSGVSTTTSSSSRRSRGGSSSSSRRRAAEAQAKAQAKAQAQAQAKAKAESRAKAEAKAKALAQANKKLAEKKAKAEKLKIAKAKQAKAFKIAQRNLALKQARARLANKPESQALAIAKKVQETGQITREQAAKFEKLGFDKRQLSQIAVEKLNLNKKKRLFDKELKRIEQGGKLNSRKLFELGLDSQSITTLAERATTIKDVKEFGRIGRDLFNQSLNKTLKKLEDPRVILDTASSQNLFKIQVNRELEKSGERQLKPNAPLKDFEKKYKERILPKLKSNIIAPRKDVEKVQRDFLQKVKDDTNRKAIKNFLGLRLNSKDKILRDKYALALSKVQKGQKLTTEDKNILDKGFTRFAAIDGKKNREFLKGVIVDFGIKGSIKAAKGFVKLAEFLAVSLADLAEQEGNALDKRLQKDGVKDFDKFLKKRYIQDTGINTIVKGAINGTKSAKEFSNVLVNQFKKDPKGTMIAIGGLIAIASSIAGASGNKIKNKFISKLGTAIRTGGARGAGKVIGEVGFELYTWYAPAKGLAKSSIKLLKAPKKIISIINSTIRGGIITTKKLNAYIKKYGLDSIKGRKKIYALVLKDLGIDLTERELLLLDEKLLLKSIQKITRKPKTLKLDGSSKSIDLFKKLINNKKKIINKELYIEALVSKSGFEDIGEAAKEYRRLLSGQKTSKLKSLLKIKAEKNSILKDIVNKFTKEIQKLDIKRQKNILKGISTKKANIELLLGISNLDGAAKKEYSNLLLRQVNNKQLNRLITNAVNKGKLKNINNLNVIFSNFITKVKGTVSRNKMINYLRNLKSKNFKEIKISLMVDWSNLEDSAKSFYRRELSLLDNKQISRIFKNKFKLDDKIFQKKIELIQKIRELKITPFGFESGLKKSLSDLRGLYKRDLKAKIIKPSRKLFSKKEARQQLSLLGEKISNEKYKTLTQKKINKLLEIKLGLENKKTLIKSKSKLELSRINRKKDLQSQLKTLGVPISDVAIEQKSITDLIKIRNKAVTNYEKLQKKRAIQLLNKDKLFTKSDARKQLKLLGVELSPSEYLKISRNEINNKLMVKLGLAKEFKKLKLKPAKSKARRIIEKGISFKKKSLAKDKELVVIKKKLKESVKNLKQLVREFIVKGNDIIVKERVRDVTAVKYIDLTKPKIKSKNIQKQVQTVKEIFVKLPDQLIKEKNIIKAKQRINNIKKSLLNKAKIFDNQFKKTSSLEKLKDISIALISISLIAKKINNLNNNFSLSNYNILLNNVGKKQISLKQFNQLFGKASKLIKKSKTKQDVLRKLDNKQKLAQSDLNIIKQDSRVKQAVVQGVKLKEMLKRPQLLKNILKKKPPVKPIVPPLPRLSFDSKRLKDRIGLFIGKYRERQNPNKPFNKRTNKVVVKTLRIKDTKNRALKKVSDLADRKAIRSIDIKLASITTTKKKDIGSPKVLNKFRTTKSKLKDRLNLVEKAKHTLDMKTERRELASLKKKKKGTTKKKAKVVRKKKRKSL